MKRIADLRPKIDTLDAAKAVMAQIAADECFITAELAKAEKRVQKIKAAVDEKIACQKERRQANEELLASFIMANRQLFKSPRKIKTSSGEFGLQKVNELEVFDQDSLIAYIQARISQATQASDANALETWMNCLKVTSRPVKSQVKTLASGNGAIPGCQIVTGDTAVCKVSKTLLDEAKQVED